MPLCLHAGAKPIARADLANVPVPAATRTYAPVSHAQFVDTIESKLAGLGYHFGEAAFGLTNDGMRMFGVAQLRGGFITDGYALTVGMRASLDKSMAPRVAFGSHVFVCDNMAFTGEVMFSRKQTTFIARDLPLLAAEACAKVGLLAARQDARFEAYKNMALDDRDASHGIIEMLRTGVINTQRVEKVVREWHEPSHDHGTKSVWRLFNAATEVLKDAPIAELPRRTIGLQSIADTLSQFKLAA